MEVSHGSAQVTAFVMFSAVVAGTPGPSNALLAAIGTRTGVRRGLASLLGQVSGMGAMLFAVILGLGGLLFRHPWTLQVLMWVAVAMLCWLAWRIAITGPSQAAELPGGFLRMAVFQWVNPKGWLISFTAAATFVDPHAGGALGQAATLVIVFMMVAVTSCFPWLAFGAALQHFLQTPRAWAVFRYAMAGALVASLAPFVWGRV